MNTKKILQALTNFVLEKPLVSIILSLMLAGALVPQVRNMTADFSYRIWFDEEDPLLKKFDAFERQFGNDENIAILIETPNGVFQPESVKIIQALTEKMWLAPDIIRVDSLSNYNYTQAEGDDIMVDPFLPSDVELSPEYLAGRREIALNDEVIPYYLMSPDAKSAMIYARMKPALEKIPMYKDTVDFARKTVSELNDGNHKFHITGSGAINVTFQEVSEKDMQTMLPILIVLVILFLVFSFRAIGGVIYPFVIIGVSILASFGIGAANGYTFNVMLSSVPSTLIAICIADVIHILMSYYIFRRRGAENKDAIRKTLDKNLVPTIVTSISTAIGFFSLAPAKILPIAHMGILDGAGTLLAWVFTIFLVIPLLIFFPIKVKKKEEEVTSVDEDYIHPFAEKYTNFLSRNRKAVIAVMTALTIGSFYLAVKTEVNSDPYNYFSSEVPLKLANETMEEQLGGSMGAELAVNSGEADGVKNPEFLKKLDHFQAWLLSQEYIEKVVAVTDIVKGMNRSLNGGKQEFYSLADDQQVIAQQLFLYTMSLPQGMDINNRITLDNQSTRMTLIMNIHDSKTVLAEFDRWEKYAKSIGLDAQVTGKIPLYQKMNGYVVDTFFKSMSMALVLVSLLMILVFRSWKIGLLSMIPNTVPLVFGGAIMFLLNKPVDMGTVVIISVCLGIAVDDTVHVLANYLKHRRSGMSPEKSFAKVLTYTGPALILTTIILVCGFGTFMFATFIPNVNFGVMTATILTAALVVDFTLLPAILLADKKAS